MGEASTKPTPIPEPTVAQASITDDYQEVAQPDVLIAGRYTLQQKIGERRMGEVWVAKHTEPVKRKVALKLIKTGMDSKAVPGRLEQERQALAIHGSSQYRESARRRIDAPRAAILRHEIWLHNEVFSSRKNMHHVDLPNLDPVDDYRR